MTMTMTMIQEPCGDTCSVVASMASTFKEFVPKEQRMAQAIAAVQSGKMSQRAAAKEFGIPETTLRSNVRRMAHPETSQPTTTKSKIKADPKTIKLTSNDKRTALHKLCKQHDAPMGELSGTPSKMRGWLEFAGIEIPSELDGARTPFNPSLSQSDDTHQQRLHAQHPLPVVTKRGAEANSEPEHPAFADTLNIDAVREQVNREVQQSDRPADFKRAIELLTELDRICTDAWYRRHPEPWEHDDWSHVASEIRALHSIVGQRAEEKADEILQRTTSITVESTAVT